MSRPWRRYDLGGGLVVRLQVLDVTTAFEREPELCVRLDGSVLRMLSDPDAVLGWLWATAQKAADPQLAALRLSAHLATQLLSGLAVDGRWLAGIFREFVLERVEVEGELVEAWRQLAAFGLTPFQRWRLLGLQLAQTFGPLWERSPYRPSARATPDYGVSPPPSPLAVQWAGLVGAQLGTSPVVILREWTPVELIEQVEILAYQAEVSRRAQDAASVSARGG